MDEDKDTSAASVEYGSDSGRQEDEKKENVASLYENQDNSRSLSPSNQLKSPNIFDPFSYESKNAIDSVIHTVISQAVGAYGKEKDKWGDNSDVFLSGHKVNLSNSSYTEQDTFSYQSQENVTTSNSNPPATNNNTVSLGREEDIGEIDLVDEVTLPGVSSNSQEAPTSVDPSLFGSHDTDKDPAETLSSDEKLEPGDTISESSVRTSMPGVAGFDLDRQADSGKSFGQLDDSEVSFLRKAIGDVIKRQGGQRMTLDDSTDSFQQISSDPFSLAQNELSSTAEGIVNLGTELDIAAAEYDFESVVPRCKEVSVYAKDRTEEDAKALLDHIIKGEPDSCFGTSEFVPATFGSIDEDDKLSHYPGKDSTSSLRSDYPDTEEIDVTLHNTTASLNGMPRIMETSGEGHFGINHAYHCGDEGDNYKRKSKLVDTERVRGENVDDNGDENLYDAISGDPREACFSERDVNKKGSQNECVRNVNDSVVDPLLVEGLDNAPENIDIFIKESVVKSKELDNEVKSSVGNKDLRDLQVNDNDETSIEEKLEGCRTTFEHFVSKFDFKSITDKQWEEYENSNVIQKPTTGVHSMIAVSGDKPVKSENNIQENLKEIETKLIREVTECNSKTTSITNIDQPGLRAEDRKVETTHELGKTASELSNNMNGMICPCNSEIMFSNSEHVKAKRTCDSMESRKIQNQDHSTSSTKFLTKDSEPKAEGKMNPRNQCDTGSNFKGARKESNMKSSFPLAKKGLETPQLLPSIHKTWPSKKPLINNKKTFAGCNSSKTRKLDTSVKESLMTGQVRTEKKRNDKHPFQDGERLPAKSPQKFPHLTDSITGYRVKAKLENTALSSSRGRKDTEDKGIAGRHHPHNLLDSNLTKRGDQTLYTAEIIPRNTNDNKLGQYQFNSQQCLDEVNIKCEKSFGSSSSWTNVSSTSSFMPDCASLCMTRQLHSAQKLRSSKNAQDPPHPDTFTTSLNRPKMQPTKLYTPKKHLRPGASSAEEYHRYKMDLRLSQSLARIKQGPPTVDCYLDPRLKKRQDHSRSRIQKRNHDSSLFLADNISMVEMMNRNKTYSRHVRGVTWQ